MAANDPKRTLCSWCEIRIGWPARGVLYGALGMVGVGYFGVQAPPSLALEPSITMSSRTSGSLTPWARTISANSRRRAISSPSSLSSSAELQSPSIFPRDPERLSPRLQDQVDRDYELACNPSASLLNRPQCRAVPSPGARRAPTLERSRRHFVLGNADGSAATSQHTKHGGYGIGIVRCIGKQRLFDRL